MTQDVSITTGKITRYLVRNSLFRVRDDRVENPVAYAIWEHIRKQLKGDEHLHNFTFTWDVLNDDPLTVIRRNEWDAIKREKYPVQYKTQTPVEEETVLFTGQK